MARVIFSTEIQRFTHGAAAVDVSADRYPDLVAELCRKYPDLPEETVRKQALAIDGLIIQTPLLERFGADSELVFFARIAGG